MSFVSIVVCCFCSLVVIEKEGVVWVGENYVLSDERCFEEGVVCVYLLEYIVVSVHKTELAVAFASRLVVKV